MSFEKKWKSAKTKYEKDVSAKKPGKKILGLLQKRSGVGAACKKLDAAVEKQSRSECEKALKALEKVGNTYLATLEDSLKKEPNLKKQIKGKTLQDTLDEILIEAHNEVKGMDSGVFDQTLGPDIMTRMMGLKYSSDAFVKSFATNKQFVDSFAGTGPATELKTIQNQFGKHMKVANQAQTVFLANRGKNMKKTQILKIARATSATLFDQVGREGMLGQIAYWQRQQLDFINAMPDPARKKEASDKFQKSTFVQVLQKVGKCLNDDAVKLNKVSALLKSLKID